MKKKIDFQMVSINFFAIGCHLFSFLVSFNPLNDFISSYLIGYDSFVFGASIIVLFAIELILYQFLTKTVIQAIKGIDYVQIPIAILSIIVLSISVALTVIGSGKMASENYAETKGKPLKQTETAETRQLKSTILAQNEILLNIRNSAKTRKSNWTTPNEKKISLNASKILLNAEVRLLEVNKSIEVYNNSVSYDNEVAKESVNDFNKMFGAFSQLLLLVIMGCKYSLYEQNIDNTLEQTETNRNSGNGNTFKLATLNGIDKPILSIMAKNPNMVYAEIVKKMQEMGTKINTGDITNVVKNAAVQGYNYDKLQTA